MVWGRCLLIDRIYLSIEFSISLKSTHDFALNTQLHKLIQLNVQMKLKPTFAFFNISVLFFHLHFILLHWFYMVNQHHLMMMASIVPRAEIHTVCRIIRLAKKVNRNHVRSVRVNTVIFHHCVMVTLRSQL